MMVKKVSNEPLISEKLRSMIGKEVPSLTRVTEIDRRLVANFTQAIEDPNSMWESEDFFGKIKEGDIAPASILWTRGISYKGRVLAPFLSELPPNGVDAGGEWEIFRPVRIGDVITAKTKLSEVYEQESRSRGKMLMVITETTYTNQQGDVVGTYKHNMLRYA